MPVRAAWMAAFALLAAAACHLGPEAPRVLLVGVDGVDPDIVDRLVGEGRLPTFARLRREGAHGRLRSREPLLSPVLWTTIATGRKGQDHGVLDFVESTRDGRVVPITSTRRRVPALWNVLGQFGRRSGFVGWYASYPAETVKGFMVTDRTGFHQVKSAKATRGATYPEELAEELRTSMGEPVPDPARTRSRFVDPAAGPLTPDGARRLERLAELHATTELYRRALPWLAERRPVDLLGVYFELVDACGHLFMEDAPPRRPGIAEADFRAFSGTVDRCYDYQDEVLADVLRLEGRDTVTVVVSDHGFKSGRTRPETSGRADTGLAPLWHRLHGVVFMEGGAVKAGGTIEGATVLDVAPTVLSVLGLPLSRELQGQPLRQAFAPRAFPERDRVERYAAANPPSAEPAEGLDDAQSERVERLRALGYVGAAPTLAHDDEGRTAASYLNEGSARAADGDLDGALQAFARAVELDPRNVNGRVFAARIHVHRGDLGSARTLLDEALRLDPRSLAVRLQRASWAIEARRWDEASSELAATAALDERLPNLHLLRARVAAATGKPETALAELRAAEGLTDSEGLLGEIQTLQARLALDAGRLEEAEQALRRARELVPRTALAEAEGDLALARRDGVRAAASFKEALRERPGDSVLERKLGQALGAAGDHAAAEDAFRRAVDKARNDEEREGGLGDLALLHQMLGHEDASREVLVQAVATLPRSAPLWGMLGAAWGRAGNLDQAIAAYERSVSLRPSPLACKTLAALVFERTKDRPRAVSLWRQSLALDTRQPDVERFLREYDRPVGRGFH